MEVNMLFNEFVGQDEIKEYLKKSIKDNNVSHGYIFEGNKGIGKYNMALLFAQSLLCDNFSEEPCNECSSCIKVNTMNHPDLHIISTTDKSIKREVIDELIESINQKPYESERKIYIIKNSEDMTPQAANTFLKTLEEPIGNTIIILLTENSNLLLPTISSRCQIIKFKRIDNSIIASYVKDKFRLDSNTAKLIAYYSQGVLLNAEKIALDENDILKRRSEIIKIYDKILSNDRNIIFEYEEYFEENKDNIDELIEILMAWLRDIYFKKYGINDLIINTDYMDLLDRHSKIVKTHNIDKLIKYLQNVSYDIKNNVNYKLIIDNMLIKLQEEVKVEGNYK